MKEKLVVTVLRDARGKRSAQNQDAAKEITRQKNERKEFRDFALTQNAGPFSFVELKRARKMKEMQKGRAVKQLNVGCPYKAQGNKKELPGPEGGA